MNFAFIETKLVKNVILLSCFICIFIEKVLDTCILVKVVLNTLFN